jgi:hypothetical protein
MKAEHNGVFSALEDVGTLPEQNRKKRKKRGGMTGIRSSFEKGSSTSTTSREARRRVHYFSILRVQPVHSTFYTPPSMLL